MEKMGVISRISEPTDWCVEMVVVPKANGKVRICVHLTNLNNSMCRERHPLLAVEQTMAQLAEAKIFSKLDANSGFWQITLSQKSIPLTTFEGAVCLIDSVLVYGRKQEEYNECLLKVLCCLQNEGLTLNRDKCQFSQKQVPFLGQVVDESGIRPDPQKVTAIRDV